uniref:Uncharacterized protein n=1 Tax=Rhizophora mucronata TaxID=61149 RepID=A0A2P2QCG8_RHIMU
MWDISFLGVIELVHKLQS